MIRDADHDWPTMLRPVLNSTGSFGFGVPWAMGRILPNEDFRNIDQFSNSGIRAMVHNGQVKVIADSEFFEIATVHQLHMFTLQLKPAV